MKKRRKKKKKKNILHIKCDSIENASTCGITQYKNNRDYLKQ